MPNGTTYEQITFEERDNVALITLNRPERLNAWTHKMMAELVDATSYVNDSLDLGAIVITGAGRGFCAGADIGDTFKKGIEDREKKGGDASSNRAADWVAHVRQSKPIIAAVNGPSIGVGLTMILPADVIVASEAAKFGAVFVKMGIVPELASSHYLVSRMGWGNASEFLLAAQMLSGTEAKEKGLCEHVVPADQLMDKAFSIASAMAENPSRQVRMTKQLLSENACETDISAAQRRELEFLEQCYVSAEHKEAVDAFLNKRKPDFKSAILKAAS